MAEPAQRADLILALGGDQLLMGQHERAVARFNEAIAIDPNCAEAYAWLGKAYREMGRLKEAEDAFRKAIRVRPDFALAHYNLGLLHASRGERDAALRQYERLREIHPVRAERLLDQIPNQNVPEQPEPSDVETLLDDRKEEVKVAAKKQGRGGATPKRGRKPDSRVVETVADFSERAVPEPVWDELENVVESALSSADETQVIEDAPSEAIDPVEPRQADPPPPPSPEIDKLRQAVASNPRDSQTHWRLGRAYVEAGDHTQAAAAIEQAIANRVDFAGSHPDSVRESVEMCLALGLCHERLGKFQDAAGVYEQALDIDPDNAEAHLRLGLVMVVLNNRRDAMGCYRALARLDPERAEPLMKRLLRVLSK